MAFKLPPSPVGQPPGNSFWNDWYEKLRTLVNGSQEAVSVVQAQVDAIKATDVITASTSSAFSNERVLTAGTNVTLDLATPGQLIVNSAAGLTPITSPSVLANVSGSSAVPTSTTVTQLLDSVFGTTPGKFIYRDATNWASLNPGSTGQVLALSGAVPYWGTLAPAGGSANITADIHPVVANPADDEFETGATIDTAGTRFAGATAWSWVNQGTASTALANGSLVLSAPAATSANARQILQPVSGTAWKYRVALLNQASVGGTTNTFQAGILVRNSANGRMLTYGRGYFTSIFRILVQRWASSTSVNTTLISGDIFGGTNAYRSVQVVAYLEIELAAGVLSLRFSDHGINGTYLPLTTETVATYLGAVDQIGLYVDTTNNLPTIGVFDWFRRVA